MTISYLRSCQLWGRLWFKCRRPRVAVRPAPPTAKLSPKTGFPTGYTVLDEAGFHFLNRVHKAEAAWNRAEWGKLWLYNLHYFDCLRQAGITEAEGNALIERWIAENPPFRGNGWEPYPLSLRIVNWIKWALSGHELTGEALASLALQTRYLRKRLERHLLANHLFANAKALVFAGMFFSGKEAEKWLIEGCEICREQLPEQILADGGHFERSPMYHSIILEDLLDLVNINAPLFLTLPVAKMLNYLAVMTGPDGTIGRFNDAADGIALAPETLFDYAARLGFERPAEPPACVDLPASGYARLAAGEWTALCDGGAIGPDCQPGHAHADTLSFELWYGKTRLLLDSGTGEYIDTPLRREQRGTAGHNTLTVNGKNSSDVWGAHRVARRARIVARAFGNGRFSAAHDGFRPVRHEREWEVAPGGVAITDRLDGEGKYRIDLYWHFPPDAEVTLRRDHVSVAVGGRSFKLTLSGCGEHEVAVGHYSPEFGVVREIPVLHSCYHSVLPHTMQTILSLE